jgi:hypothetical protein
LLVFLRVFATHFLRKKRNPCLRVFLLTRSHNFFFVCGSVASLSSWQSLLDAAAGQFTIHTHCILHSGKWGFRLKLFSELEHHLTRNVLKSLCRYSDSPSPKRASRGRSRSRTPPRRSDHLIPVLFLCHSVISVLLYARSISGKPMNEKL